jgi:hypothetical protein
MRPTSQVFVVDIAENRTAAEGIQPAHRHAVQYEVDLLQVERPYRHRVAEFIKTKRTICLHVDARKGFEHFPAMPSHGKRRMLGKAENQKWRYFSAHQALGWGLQPPADAARLCR